MVTPVYLDYNGTTPHDPEVIEAMRPFLEEEFGNPSSTHWYGIKPRQAVERARRQVAALLNCSPEEIVFTSGGTESNNHAVKGIAQALRHQGNHIITTEIEHPAILEVCRYLEKFGVKSTYLPVDRYGQVDPADIEAAITPETLLITIMHANNETGTIQPIETISRLAEKYGILMHTDAAQSIGKIPTDVKQLGVDLLSVAGHKIYAPKGIGALFIRKSVHPEKFCHGAGQEMGRRAGTENVMGIVGLGMACEIAKRDLQKNIVHMKALRDRLEEGLMSISAETRLNGHPVQRLPNTLNISFRGLEANRIIEAVGLDIAISAGAACHSDEISVSHVLEAMRIPIKWAKGTLRISTGRMTRRSEVEHALNVLIRAVKQLQPYGTVR